MNAPGAITGAPLAAFRIPPFETIGVAVLAVTGPDNVPFPKRPLCDTPCKVIIALAAAFDGTHVADHSPPPSGFKGTAGSPFENEALTVPLLRLLPQLSKTVTSSGVGCPTAVWNPDS